LKIYQSLLFEKKIKKFNKQEKEILDNVIENIANNPSIGDMKKGDLIGVYVYKFKIKTVQYLLAYRIKNDNLELIMIGHHENYYRDLKTYIKTR
jgi:mRNA-degrading endonuclease RelE of RelBE toxin-antitoxin system